MKRGTADNPKTKRLARALGVETWGACGVLELLWHFTAKHAIKGDIGRWSDQEIADAIDWKDDSEKFVKTLVETGWLDLCKDHRLLVHDWEDHADESVKKTLKNRSEDFAKHSGKVKKRSARLSFPSLAKPKPSQASLCSEPQAASEPPDLEVVMSFETVGEGPKIWGLAQAKLDEYQQSYPGIDALAECRKALQWSRDNPTKRKTAKGMPKFLSGWLSRAQDSGRPAMANGQHELRPALDPNIFKVPEDRT